MFSVHNRLDEDIILLNYHGFKPRQGQAVVLSKKYYTHATVIVVSRNGLDSVSISKLTAFYTIELK